MDETEVRYVLEAALLASDKPLPLDKLVELFAKKAPDVDKSVVRAGLDALAAEYENRGLELKEVASGYRVQVRSRMSAWLQPLWEERPPRYSRALLETLALVAYRQPVTRGEIEEVRGVTVNSNIIRSMLERNWIRVVGHRDVPGKPEMFGTTKEFLDYFGLRSIDQLPALAEIREHGPEAFPQADFIEGLEVSTETDESGSGEDSAVDASAAPDEVAEPAEAARAMDSAEQEITADAADDADADIEDDGDTADSTDEVVAADDADEAEPAQPRSSVAKATAESAESV